MSEPSEDALERILSKLELKYNFHHIQDNPTVVTLALTTDTPFASVGLGDNEDIAKIAAVRSAFEMMNVFMRVILPQE